MSDHMFSQRKLTDVTIALPENWNYICSVTCERGLNRIGDSVMKLTKKRFWDQRSENNHRSTDHHKVREGMFRQFVDNARRRRGAQPGQSYSDFAVYNLLRSHLPVRPDWSVIEIGCAPGRNLVHLQHMFGYEPYGIEYSHPGVISTLQTFHEHGFNTANVIEADFFDQKFHSRFKGSFDVVFSTGFIEHFDPPCDVLGLHVNLLRSGGYLICIIPNLRGLFYPLIWLCAHDLVKMHNCNLMRKKVFSSVFEPLGLDVEFCGYVGALQFYGQSFLKSKGGLCGVAASLLGRLQDVLDHFMFLSVYRGDFPESPLSANLIFVGKRI